MVAGGTPLPLLPTLDENGEKRAKEHAVLAHKALAKQD
jgi:hypothetical protein